MGRWSVGEWWKERGRRSLSSTWWLQDAQPQHWIALFASILILVDTFVRPLTFVALGLAILAVLPWLLRLVRRLELPGGVTVEMRDFESVAEKAKDAGLLPEEPALQPPRPAYQTVFNDDPVLALAGLRIELERRINELAAKAGWGWQTAPDSPKRLSLLQQVRRLRAEEVLTVSEASVIADLLPLLNTAVHSRNVPSDAARWAIENGPPLLASLDAKIALMPGPIT